MLGNRNLQIKMVKDEPRQLGAAPAAPAVPIEDTVDAVTESIVSGAVTILGTYMLADTVRKIVIHAFTR